jgi:hypothetical protein
MASGSCMLHIPVATGSQADRGSWCEGERELRQGCPDSVGAEGAAATRRVLTLPPPPHRVIREALENACGPAYLYSSEDYAGCRCL